MQLRTSFSPPNRPQRASRCRTLRDAKPATQTLNSSERIKADYLWRGVNPAVANDLIYQSNWLTLNIGGRNYGVSGFRLYDPDLGTFLSRDRLPYINRYRAWSNNPVGQVDRDGLRESDVGELSHKNVALRLAHLQMSAHLLQEAKNLEERHKKLEADYFRRNPNDLQTWRSQPWDVLLDRAAALQKQSDKYYKDAYRLFNADPNPPPVRVTAPAWMSKLIAKIPKGSEGQIEVVTFKFIDAKFVAFGVPGFVEGEAKLAAAIVKCCRGDGSIGKMAVGKLEASIGGFVGFKYGDAEDLSEAGGGGKSGTPSLSPAGLKVSSDTSSSLPRCESKIGGVEFEVIFKAAASVGVGIFSTGGQGTWGIGKVTSEGVELTISQANV